MFGIGPHFSFHLDGCELAVSYDQCMDGKQHLFHDVSSFYALVPDEAVR